MLYDLSPEGDTHNLLIKFMTPPLMTRFYYNIKYLLLIDNIELFRLAQSKEALVLGFFETILKKFDLKSMGKIKQYF